MSLTDQFVRQGLWLFRWRSYLPLIVFPLLVLAMQDGEYFETHFGETVDLWWGSFSIAVTFFGFALRIFTVGFVPSGTSGRGTRTQKADVLNQTGMYSIVRHPLYSANYVIFIGALMFAQSLWFMLVGTLAYWLYYERIMYAEEDFLRKKFKDAYARWAAITPAVLPNLRRWTRPELPFSLRSVLAREHSTMLTLVALLTVIELVSTIIEGETPILDRDWVTFLMTGAVLYLFLRTIKKHTRLLQADGR